MRTTTIWPAISDVEAPWSCLRTSPSSSERSSKRFGRSAAGVYVDATLGLGGHAEAILAAGDGRPPRRDRSRPRSSRPRARTPRAIRRSLRRGGGAPRGARPPPRPAGPPRSGRRPGRPRRLLDAARQGRAGVLFHEGRTSRHAHGPVGPDGSRPRGRAARRGAGEDLPRIRRGAPVPGGRPGHRRRPARRPRSGRRASSGPSSPRRSAAGGRKDATRRRASSRRCASQRTASSSSWGGSSTTRSRGSRSARASPSSRTTRSRTGSSRTRFRERSAGCSCPPSFPVCVCSRRRVLALVTKKPVRPSPEEVFENRRARSARMRVAETDRPGASEVRLRGRVHRPPPRRERLPRPRARPTADPGAPRPPPLAPPADGGPVRRDLDEPRDLPARLPDRAPAEAEGERSWSGSASSRWSGRASPPSPGSRTSRASDSAS